VRFHLTPSIHNNCWDLTHTTSVEVLFRSLIRGGCHQRTFIRMFEMASNTVFGVESPGIERGELTFTSLVL